MERNLALEVVRVTEAAALSSARWMGLGNAKAADQASVDAMRRGFDAVSFCGSVVIGQGERDEAPMLFVGERIGGGEGPELDVALDPLEGSDGAIRSIAGFFHGVISGKGQLLLGHSESLSRITDIFKPIRNPNVIVYTKKDF